MRSLKWRTSHAVFVTEIDDEHKEIFEMVSNLQKALSGSGPSLEIRKLTQRLTACIVGHFAHEERLMQAARYGSINWHKQQHDAARRRVGQFVLAPRSHPPGGSNDGGVPTQPPTDLQADLPGWYQTDGLLRLGRRRRRQI